LLLLRLEGRIFFANAEQIGQKIRVLVSEAQPKVVVLDLSPVFDLEYTALKALCEGEKRQREHGIDTWLVGLNPGVLQMVRRSPLGKALGREGMQFSLEHAVARYLQLSAAGFDGSGMAKL
jgi:anti-anti-sigma factor